jgi:hypothetical protein
MVRTSFDPFANFFFIMFCYATCERVDFSSVVEPEPEP